MPAGGSIGIREKMRGKDGLDALEAMLNRDYRVFTYLLEHAAGHGLNSIEDRILVLDFRIMRWWFRLTRVAAPRQALDALSEMSLVLNVLIAKFGPPAKLQGEPIPATCSLNRLNCAPRNTVATPCRSPQSTVEKQDRPVLIFDRPAYGSARARRDTFVKAHHVDLKRRALSSAVRAADS